MLLRFEPSRDPTASHARVRKTGGIMEQIALDQSLGLQPIAELGDLAPSLAFLCRRAVKIRNSGATRLFEHTLTGTSSAPSRALIVGCCC